MAMLRQSVYFFLLLALLAVPAFWPSYLSRIGEEKEAHVHAHGAVMALWLLMLISQASLIRTDRRALHRRIGKLSYVLAPLVVLSTLSLAHLRLHESGDQVSTDQIYFLYVQFALLGLFLLTYFLAIYHRKSRPVHARYMACTALTLIDPITARLLYNHLGIDFPMAQVVTYSAIDVLLLWLALRDWRATPRWTVFARMLPVFVAAQIPTFFVYQAPAWRAFALWYGRLPML